MPPKQKENFGAFIDKTAKTRALILKALWTTQVLENYCDYYSLFEYRKNK